MTRLPWAVIRNAAGTAVEHVALVSDTDTVVSTHEAIGDARKALVELRERLDREAAIEAGQMEMFE